jgi:sugar/nucleoside kinase (ribokinase family)
VGEDFGDDEFEVFQTRGIITDDIKRVPGGSSFFWAGRYDKDMSVAQTLDTQLNVFADFDPALSLEARDCSILFLANIQPDLQQRVRAQCHNARFVGLDSMNYWIESARDSLVTAMRSVDAIIFNDVEVRMLTGEPNLSAAARCIRQLGPRVLFIKQGAYGACMYTREGFFSIPAYPLETVVDPTGAGDAFAGGLCGYLDSLEGDRPTENQLRCAAVYGSVLASFTVEDFGTERLQELTEREIAERFEEFRQMTVFEAPPVLATLKR